ncbi:MAG: 2-oxo acid dehydrogenase subunit E2 [Bacilli bacterium]|nr:2-oxo acid dehydrogenase subunit E2 [Bacilli bacterium]MDD4407308.1 2-oxo acid dehydrogenase subunit E2 [Bacilli bacterium]
MKNRKDGIRVKNLSGINSLIPHLKPSRADSDVYINMKIDVSELVKYYEKLRSKKETKDITYFHIFCSAMGMVIYNRPLLNRFIINKKFYDRKHVSISFVAKKEFTDDSEETLNLVKIDKDDNLFSLGKKLIHTVEEVRNQNTNSADDLVTLIGKMPKFVKSFIMAIVRFGDNHDLLPSFLTENLIYYSSVLVSNLGSINCGAIYHNLTDFGTNSILITIGEIKDEPVVIDGKIEIRKMCELGANLDERIADGFYFVKSLKLFEHILKNPELLENKSNTKIDF